MARRPKNAPVVNPTEEGWIDPFSADMMEAPVDASGPPPEPDPEAEALVPPLTHHTPLDLDLERLLELQGPAAAPPCADEDLRSALHDLGPAMAVGAVLDRLLEPWHDEADDEVTSGWTDEVEADLPEVTGDLPELTGSHVEFIVGEDLDDDGGWAAERPVVDHLDSADEEEEVLEIVRGVPEAPSYTDRALEALLAEPVFDEDGDGDGLEQVPLHQMARNVVAQHGEIILAYVREMYAGTPTPEVEARFTLTRTTLRRLAVGAGDHALTALLDDLDEIGALRDGSSTSPRSRDRLLSSLRRWTLTFAELLGPAGEALRRTVTMDQPVPALERLRPLQGMNDRLLERLYASGLVTTEALASADPEELAEVTGMPRGLARRVVIASRLPDGVASRQVVDQFLDSARAVAVTLEGLRPEANDWAVEVRLALLEVHRILDRKGG